MLKTTPTRKLRSIQNTDQFNCLKYYGYFDKVHFVIFTSIAKKHGYDIAAEQKNVISYTYLLQLCSSPEECAELFDDRTPIQALKYLFRCYEIKKSSESHVLTAIKKGKNKRKRRVSDSFLLPPVYK